MDRRIRQQTQKSVSRHYTPRGYSGSKFSPEKEKPTSNGGLLEFKKLITNKSDNQTRFSNSCITQEDKFEVVDVAGHGGEDWWNEVRNCGAGHGKALCGVC